MNARILLRHNLISLLPLVCLFGMLACVGVVGDASGSDWPMWRHDAGRTARTSESLPAELHLQWTRQLPATTPAFRSKRLQFDRSYEPIVMGEQLFVALPHNDSVVAYNTRTGAQQWQFFADGPVRCAPVAWQGKLYFGSDDGYIYSLNASDGALRWRFRAVPSSRKVMGNGRLVSLWPVRGGPVLVDGILYFAAGVWPFEGVFIYAMNAETGDVIWMNDRTSYLYGRHPHNSEAMGGLTPQGYLLVDGDDLLVPCGTARPATFDRHTGELKSFSLPGEGRFPGGWFMTMNTQEARDKRRGKVVFDSEVNRDLHEDKMHIGVGEPGPRSRVSIGGKTLNFADGFDGVSGEIHSILAADSRLFVVSLDGEIYCFGSVSIKPFRYEAPVPAKPHPADAWTALAARILAATDVTSGYALVLGTKNGRLAEELAMQTELKIIALTASPQIRQQLRRRFDEVGIPAQRLAVHCVEPSRPEDAPVGLARFGLPPYLANLIVAEDWTAAGITKGPELAACVFERLQPYGGVAFFDKQDVEQQEVAAWARSAQLENASVEPCERGILLRRDGALPGAVNYTGEWTAPDQRVGAPLGILWYDDSLMHFKRALQPLFVNGVMISRDKDWTGDAVKPGPGPQMHFPGTARFQLKEARFMDMYTGRVLPSEAALARIGTIPEALAGESRPPYQIRPPFVNEAPTPGSTNKPALPFHREVARGEMVNPMTGLKEPRNFMKSYGCDGGNDYGYLITMRSATPAFYDKRIESGTINISGPRSGCTNSIIPACGVLNIPYFYDGCTCSYPLPVGAALVRMPQTYEQWTAWKGTDSKAAIQRVGINLGAPGDRMTNAGTLWLDHPSVGGPSPSVSVETQPDSADYFYHHSLWTKGGSGWPWVCASGATGLSRLQVNGLRKGSYTVRLYFIEPEHNKSGQRVLDLALQGKKVLEAFDIFDEADGKMRCIVKEFAKIEITDSVKVELTAKAGQTILSGIEIVRDDLPLDVLPVSSASR